VGVYARVGVARASAPDAQALSGVAAVGGHWVLSQAHTCKSSEGHGWWRGRGGGGGAVGAQLSAQDAQYSEQNGQRVVGQMRKL